jgi:hypothetical protein
MMRKISKIFIASLLAVSLGMATVICCCVAPAVMVHFHKVSVCSHCESQNSSQTHSCPDSSCSYKLTNAEAFHSHSISFSAPVVYTHDFFFNQHLTSTFLPSLVSAYPRGSPPLTSSFTPLYLRTFTLRV